jgi:sugar phosphate isomerase/epimerase
MDIACHQFTITEQEETVMPYASLTTWSLHRNLGPLRFTRWDEKTSSHVSDTQEQPELVSLLDLPSVLAKKGFSALEVCHFNFPETSDEYLAKLKNAFAEAGIPFYTLLIDYGDISNADETRRRADIEWIKRWIGFAAKAGAQRVRVIGGDGAPGDLKALARSAEALKELCAYASDLGVKVITENFKSLTSTSGNCLTLLEACGGRLGLTSDFGNFKGPEKYDELSKTLPLSESVHAKAVTDVEGFPDEKEFATCMEVVQRSGYEGPITLVYDGPNDMWEGIERVHALVRPYLS